MRLKGLDSDQLAFLFVQAARGFSPKQSHLALYSEFPAAKEYGVAAIRDFLRTEEAETEIDKAKSAVREKALERSFAHQGHRVDALSEIADQLRARIRSGQPKQPLKDIGDAGNGHIWVPDLEADPEGGLKPQEIAQLSSELRQTLKAIHQEMEPLAGAGEVLAPIQAMFQAMQTAETNSAEMRQKLDADETWSQAEPQ